MDESPMPPQPEAQSPPEPRSQPTPEASSRRDAPDEGWPGGMPYTVYFPDGDELRGADLEHAAPLPRVGDRVDYVDETGRTRRYVVSEVIHTLQTSARGRPAVDEGTASPESVARPGGSPEVPGGGGAIRAGLPKVILAEDPDQA